MLCHIDMYLTNISRSRHTGRALCDVQPTACVSRMRSEQCLLTWLCWQAQERIPEQNIPLMMIDIILMLVLIHFISLHDPGTEQRSLTTNLSSMLNISTRSNIYLPFPARESTTSSQSYCGGGGRRW